VHRGVAEQRRPRGIATDAFAHDVLRASPRSPPHRLELSALDTAFTFRIIDTVVTPLDLRKELRGRLYRTQAVSRADPIRIALVPRALRRWHIACSFPRCRVFLKSPR
jgi:hypothetical protein